MKFSLSKGTALFLSVVLFISALTCSLCLAFCDGDTAPDIDDEALPPTDKEITTSMDYTYKIDISAYADALNTTDEKYLVLANKNYVIGAEHVPENLTQLDTDLTMNGKEIYLSGNAADAAEALIKEMRARGYDNIYITSAYRSYDYQMSLYNTYFNKEKAAHPELSDAQIKERVLTYSAYPGTSEHQTGLCVDLFVSPGMKELENYGREGDYPDDVGFAETLEFKWLKANAHKFGFILRYPEDKVDITGYAYESWHYRFVGIDAATEIYFSGLTLEEYLGKLLN
jgi:D-alanyl-D-alanine carboxypeptidase